MVTSLYSAAFVASVLGSADIHSQDTVALPSSCIGADDGYQWMKMLDGDEYPAVHQKCDNDYMVIDINEDSNILDYFTSYTTWHHSLGGPEQMDLSNWEQWYLPNQKFLDLQDDDESLSAEYFSYIVSPDCSSCDLDNNDANNDYSMWNDDDSLNTDRTAYHMTSTMYGCQGTHKPLKDLRWDYDSYQCVVGVTVYSLKSAPDEGFTYIEDGDIKYHVVTPANSTDWDFYINDVDTSRLMGLCGVYPYSTVNAQIAVTRDECNNFQDQAENLKPSIGNKGSFCVCVKPNESFDVDTTYSVSVDDFESAQADYAEQHAPEEEDTSSVDDVHELYQTDFESGTYRIQQSGTYKIMEDITFDFNAGDVTDPSAGTSWWPQEDQSDMYPGVGTTRDEYWLGFIAGITIEADDVVIDLNDHEIKMSEALYYQQRFFACINIKSVTFPLDQGPGFFGMEPVYANNVVIKDGVIGLSSHFGIHGHSNDNVTIENVHVHSFETHGIEISHFNNLKMKNVEIGPSSTKAFLKGEYGYARWTVQALERILEDDSYHTEMLPMQFAGRSEGVEIEDVITTLTNQMDMAFKYVMGIQEYDDDDEDWAEAKALFVNPSGLPYGAVMYGLFLNLKFANVFTIHPSMVHSKNAVIENLYIHDLHHKTMEYVRLDKSGNYTYQNQFAAPLDARALLGSQIEVGQDSLEWNTAQYVGNALTDAVMMMTAITDDWGELGQSLVPEKMLGWALGEYDWNDDFDVDTPYLGCNVDRMGHIPKGLIGIRMDGVEDVVFENLEIANLKESSPLGTDVCGEYWDFVKLFQGGGNVFQNTPYYYGYSGNRVHGIFSDWSEYTMRGDIKFHDFKTDTGLVYGLGMYTRTQIAWDEESTFSIYNLAAGSELGDVDTDALVNPYNPAQAEPIHAIWQYNQSTYDKTFYSSMVGEPATLSVSCVAGRDGYNLDDKFVESMAVDNSDCDTFIATTTLSSSNLAKQGFPVEIESMTRLNDMGLVLWAALAVATLFGMWAVCRTGYPSMANSKSNASTERDPLLQEI